MILPCTAEITRVVNGVGTTASEPQIAAPFWTMAIIPLLIGVVFWVLVIICLVRVSRYFKTAGNEQKLIRMELGKLAEEVKQVRQELKHEGSE